MSALREEIRGLEIGIMATISEKITLLENFNRIVAEVVMDICKSFRNEIRDMNVAQQYAGMRSDGTDIEPSYKPITIDIKRYLGQPTDRVALRDTKDFHRSFQVLFSKTEFTIMATDKKTNELKAKYGPNIFGLDEESQDNLSAMIRPLLLEYFRNMVV